MAPGSRELATLSPLHVTPQSDAILLTGGSAFGLAAAQGVVDWLEERGAGYDTGTARVPIVPAAVVYDLDTGRPAPRPDSAKGRDACAEVRLEPEREGRVGGE